MTKSKPLTELKDADITRVDAVKGAANGTRFLLAKQADDSPAGLVSADTVRDLLKTGEPPEDQAGDTYLGEAGQVLKAEMSSADTNDLPDSDFAYIEPGGTKDETGRTVPRGNRHFQLNDEAHVRNALSRLPQSPFGSKARPKVEAAARRMGIGEPAAAVSKENAMTAPAAQTTAGAAGPDSKALKDARSVLKRARLAKKATKIEKRSRKIVAKALLVRANEALPLRKGTLHALADAHEAVLEALKDQDDPEMAKTLQGLADDIATCMSDHAMSESGSADGDGEEMTEGGGDGDGAELAKTVKTAPINLRKVRAAAKAARIAKRTARDRIQVAKAERTLAKIGRRNSSTDQTHVDAADDHLAALGATFHQSPTAGRTPSIAPAPADLAKAAEERVTNAIDLIQKAVGPLVEKDREAMRAELALVSEQLAKVAKMPLPGGPRVVLERDGSLAAATDGQPGLTFEQGALAKAAERYPVGSIERETLSKVAATSAIKDLMEARAAG